MNNNNNEPLQVCSRCGNIKPYGTTCKNCKIDYRGQFSKRQDKEEVKIRNSKRWNDKRKEIMQKASYLCEYCLTQNVLTYGRIEIHHMTPIKDNKALAYDNFNLIALCPKHHALAEKGVIDIEELKKIVKEREFLS